MVKDEDVECYMQRAPENDDKAGAPEPTNRIATNAIVPDCSMKIDMQFKLTEGSPSGEFTGPVTWRMADPEDRDGANGAYRIGELTFTPDGKLSGTIDPQLEGRRFNVLIIASGKNADTGQDVEIDSRTYNFSPKKCSPSSDLKFTHPLPGSIKTSGFGPRVHPVSGAKKDHKGVDFAYAGHVTKDALAACDGKVTKAGVGSGYGNVVYIQHVNGSGQVMAETRYAHLDKIYVSVGQQVSAGQPIGKEGNTGIGTGAHLHFELRLAGDRPVDPIDYINGEIKMSGSAKDAEQNPDPGTPEGEATKTVNTNKAVTTAKVEALSKGCKKPPEGEVTAPPPPTGEAKATSRSSCKPETKMQVAEVKQKIQQTLDKHSELDAGDKLFIMKTAEIESSYDPYAKNPTTSATGLYQFVDGTAQAYFGKIGVEPTCENRCDVEKATEAMIVFYKEAMLRFYNEFHSRGTIAGKSITPELRAKYQPFSKPVFCYGLIHHDGVGNAVKGIDRQGVKIAQSRFV